MSWSQSTGLVPAPTNFVPEGMVAAPSLTGLATGLITGQTPSQLLGKLKTPLPQGLPEPMVVEPEDSQAPVVIVDEFLDRDQSGYSHGAMVNEMAEMVGYSDSEIQCWQAPALFRFFPEDSDPDQFNKSLDRDIVRSQAALLRRQIGTLARLGQEGPRVRTVIVSSSSSPAAYAHYALLKANAPENEQRLRNALGVHTETRAPLFQAVVDRVSSVTAPSKELAELKATFDALTGELLEKGTTVFYSAGNLGDFSRLLSSHGVETPAGFYDSAFSNSSTITVASDDVRGSDINHSSPTSLADVAGIGSNEVLGNQIEGTSFSNPQVGIIADHLRSKENLEADEVKDCLRSLAQSGSGLLDYRDWGLGRNGTQNPFKR